MQKKEKKEE